MNEHNLGFYETQQGFDEMTQRFAISQISYDMHVLKPFYTNAKSILDVGAGSGRCIEILLKQGYKGHITAVDYSKIMIAELNKKFGSYPQIDIVHSSILTYSSRRRFDVALILFSVLMEFDPTERAILIKNVAKHLKSGGRLIADVSGVGLTQLVGVEFKDEQYVVLNFPYATVHSYTLNYPEIDSFADISGLKRTALIEYLLPSDRSRTAFVLEKAK